MPRVFVAFVYALTAAFFAVFFLYPTTQTLGGAWQGPNGNVILSDDPRFNPGYGWNRLQHAR